MVDYIDLRDEDFPVTCRLQRLRAVEPHYHDDHIVIMFVLRGSVSLHTGNVHCKLKEDELAFLNAEEIHYTEEEVDNEILVAHIKTAGNYYCNSKVFGKGQLAELKEQLLMLTYFYYMDELIEEDLYMKICNQIVELVNSLFKLSENRLVEYIVTNFHRHITSQYIGEKLGINGKRLTVLLQNDGAGSLTGFVAYLRCRAADKMILNTDMQVKRICRLAGFTSERSFIRDYKAYSGKTPLQQRKLYKELCRHKFYRVKDCTPYHITETIRQYTGKLHIRIFLDKAKEQGQSH